MLPTLTHASERRARAYRDAGADLIFVDGIRSLADLDEYTKRLGDLPLVYNGALLPVPELSERGFKLTIHTGTLGVAYIAMRDAMNELKETGRIAGGEDGRAFAELVNLMGAAEILDLGKRYD